MTVPPPTVEPVVPSDVPEPLPQSVVRPRQHVEAVRAQSIAETGTNGRAALSWEWALGGNRPSPVTLSLAPGRPPARDEILAEAAADPEGSTAPPGVPTDFSDQLYEARRVLAWLAGGSDEIPVDDDNRGRFIGARDDFARTDADIRLARAQHDLVAPGLADTAAPSELAGGEKADEYRADSAWPQGINDLLGWVLGDRPDSPLTHRVTGLPVARDLSFEEDAAEDLIARRDYRGVRPDAGSGRCQLPEYGEAVQVAIQWLRGEVTELPGRLE
jgi:hypothetical protein